MTTATVPGRAVRRPAMTDALRVLATVLFLLPYAVGWLARAVVTTARWVWAAAVVGWRDGPGTGQKRGRG